MAVKAGAWDCPYCGNSKIWGYVFKCPGCGVPRPGGIRFYLPVDAPTLTEEQQQMLGQDPNWYCEHCNSGNTSDNEKCWYCGAPKGFSLEHEKKVYKGDNIPRSAKEAAAMDNDDTPLVQPDKYYLASIEEFPTLAESILPSYGKQVVADEPEEEVSQNESVISKVTKPFEALISRKNLYNAGGVLAVALLVLFSYLFFFKTHEEPLAITGFHWTQNVGLEEFMTVHESGWSVPFGGRETSRLWKDTGRDNRISDGWRTEMVTSTCYRSEYHSKTCTSDNGNGSFSTYECGSSDSVPYSCTESRQVEMYHYEDIYDWYIYYDIERWINVGNFPTAGDDHQPFYDQVKPGQNQRRVEQNGSYIVDFSSENEKIGNFSRTFDIKVWTAFDANRIYTAKVNAFNTVLEIK